MSSDNSTGVVQDLGYVEPAWADQSSQYDVSAADHQAAAAANSNSQSSWLFFDPMFGSSPNAQQGYSEDKIPFTDADQSSWEAFGGGPSRRPAEIKQAPPPAVDPTLESIFTPYRSSSTERRRKCERRRPRRPANNAATASYSPNWNTSRRSVGNKSFSNSLNRFTHPDENGKRKIRNEIMSIAESLPALPGLYFDKKQKGFRVRYQNVYVGWVALSRFASIEEAYISAREIWESAKCHAEKFQTPHAAVMASYPLQKEAQASGKNRGGRPRTVTQLPPDPSNWLNTAFLAHQSSAATAVPLTTPWGEAPADVPYQAEKRRCRSPQQQPFWPSWPTSDNFGLPEDHRGEDDPTVAAAAAPDSFWGHQTPFGHALKTSPDAPASFAGTYAGSQPTAAYHLQDFSTGATADGRDYRPLCHPPECVDHFDDQSAGATADFCGLAPFAELPGAISFSQPVADEAAVLMPIIDEPPVVKRETNSPAPRKKRRRDDDLPSPDAAEDQSDVRPPPAKRRWPGIKLDGGAVSASPPPSSDVSTALPPQMQHHQSPN